MRLKDVSGTSPARAAVVTALTIATIAFSQSPAVPVARTRIEHHIVSDGPVKESFVGIRVSRPSGPGPHEVALEIDASFDREAPPYGLPQARIEVRNQRRVIYWLEAGAGPNDPTNVVWPVVDKICDAALGVC